LAHRVHCCLAALFARLVVYDRIEPAVLAANGSGVLSVKVRFLQRALV
jgi:hypothetical protein